MATNKSGKNAEDAPKYPPPEEPAKSHPTQSKAYHFPSDLRLRAAGFKIYSRKGDEEPVWERGGSTYKQTDALALIAEELRQKREAG